MSAVLNAFTIDVEEHFQVQGFETVIDRAQWDGFPSRVVANTQRILRLLQDNGARATFFILGWVADRHPGLVEDIAAAGHEIATHGYWHELIYRQQPCEFARDLRASLEAIERAAPGVRVTGYRAPSFSVTRRSLWALDVLHDHGMTYDSSIFPLAAHDRYGIGSAQRVANKLSNGMWELPVSTLRMGKYNVPVAGGGYFRLYPLWLTRVALRRLNADGVPAVIYLHPWEFDPEQPSVKQAPRMARFRHYVNLDKTEARVRSLMRDFAFSSMSEVFRTQLNGVDA